MRQPDRPYLQHGSRHGVTGSDPIPTLMAWAALHNHQGTGTTITATGLPQYISMQGGSGGSVFGTSDSTVFENAQGSGLSGDPWGIKCLLNGTYIVGENYAIGSGTVGKSVATYHTFTGGNTFSFYQPGRTGALIGDTWDGGTPSLVHTFFWELADATLTNAAPIWINPYATLESGSADIAVKVQTFVQYLGPYANGDI